MEDKLRKLHEIIAAYPYFVVAFSGGVDSAFLAAVSRKVRKDEVIALTADSGFMSRLDLDYACRAAHTIGIRHEVVSVDVMDRPEITNNGRERCYHCKKVLFEAIATRGAQLGFNALTHGVNMDDLMDFRPGLRVAEEMGILTPLVDAEFSKADIRQAARQMGLEMWNLPSQSCLATRIPFDTPISRDLVSRIEACEAHLNALGLKGIRVRCHGEVARIEAPSRMISHIATEGLRHRIVPFFRQQNFKHVSLDLAGYRSGNMN